LEPNGGLHEDERRKRILERVGDHRPRERTGARELACVDRSRDGARKRPLALTTSHTLERDLFGDPSLASRGSTHGHQPIASRTTAIKGGHMAKGRDKPKKEAKKPKKDKGAKKGKGK